MPPAPPEIRFVPTHDGQVSYGALVLSECKELLAAPRTPASIAKGLLTAALATALASALLGSLFLRDSSGRDAVVGYILTGAALFVPIAMTTLRRGRRHTAWKQHLTSMVTSQPPAGRPAPSAVVFRLLPGGLEFTAESWIGLFYWRHFERIVSHDRQIIFAHDGWSDGTMRVFAVPFDAFATPEQAGKFYEAALAHHDASGSGEQKRIQEATASFVVHCPKCHYSLARLREPRCPECGSPVSITMVRMALMLEGPARVASTEAQTTG